MYEGKPTRIADKTDKIKKAKTREESEYLGKSERYYAGRRWPITGIFKGNGDSVMCLYP
jgi:hypothetical protein